MKMVKENDFISTLSHLDLITVESFLCRKMDTHTHTEPEGYAKAKTRAMDTE